MINHFDATNSTEPQTSHVGAKFTSADWREYFNDGSYTFFLLGLSEWPKNSVDPKQIARSDLLSANLNPMYDITHTVKGLNYFTIQEVYPFEDIGKCKWRENGKFIII